jgi:hypothetical protein
MPRHAGYACQEQDRLSRCASIRHGCRTLRLCCVRRPEQRQSRWSCTGPGGGQAVPKLQLPSVSDGRATRHFARPPGRSSLKCLRGAVLFQQCQEVIDIGYRVLLAGAVVSFGCRLRFGRFASRSVVDIVADGVGSKNSAELKVPHFTRFTACQVLPSQPIDFIRQPWRPADFRQ